MVNNILTVIIDEHLLTGDHGFWIFVGLTIVTIVGMWIYFKKNKWI